MKQTIVRISFQLHVRGLTPALKHFGPPNQDKTQTHLPAALGFSSMSGVNGNVVIQLENTQPPPSLINHTAFKQPLVNEI